VSIVEFTGTLTVDLLALVGGRSRMRYGDLRNQMVICGPRALGIISLISFLMGLILAFIGAIPLRWFQAESYVASLVGIGMLRLMAPVMVGIVMAGRTSASYAAELGSMQVNEEIDAMETMGISSMQFLVLPRFIAMSLMLPLLCVFADAVSVLGGMVVATAYLKITPLSYFETLFSTARVNDLLVGIFTAFVLGILDGICGCYQGMKCGRSAAAVGSATTGAVVSSIICIVIATSLITVITVVLGL
jgi:phospholipid/cholesterol/gamma-HCH transport system permease protein